MVAKLFLCSVMIFIAGAAIGIWLQRHRRR